EGHDTLHLGHDRVSVRIPLGHDSAGIDLVAFLDGNNSTIRELVTLALTPKVASDSQLTGTGNRDQGAICALDVLQVMQADGTPVLDHNVVNSRRSAGRTTNVERTHGQLGTRFTNGLGSNNAYRLTDVDLMTTCQ